MKDEIAIIALQKLEERTGIAGSWKNTRGNTDGEIRLSVRGEKLRAYAEIKKEVRPYQIPQILEQAGGKRPLMVIGEEIYPRAKEQLRKEGISYLDIAGNIFIDEGGIYIWVDGLKAERTRKAVTNRAFTKAGLRVVFLLLCDANAINMTYREISDTTGVALGNIKNVLEGLSNAGYILQKDKSNQVLHNKKALLHRWIDGYKETLRPSLHVGNYRLWNGVGGDWEQLPTPDEATVIWGGEQAGAKMTRYLVAQEMTVYTDNKNALLRKWKLIPDDNGPLHMYELFWQFPNKYEQYAPPLLVYADLLLTGDPRCIETANKIYDKFLKNEFEGN